jgi:hypothetical protein
MSSGSATKAGANRRYLASLAALAKVRRLKLPALKVVARNALVVNS